MKPWGYYALFVAAAILGLIAILHAGTRLAPAGVNAAATPIAGSPPAGGPLMPDIAKLLLQIGVVLVASRLAGRLFRKIGQPQVVGEMAAGIVLGPSLLGWLFPGVSHFLFPPQSLGFLYALCQIGLVLYMFLVGIELDSRFLKGRGHVAVMTSHASILIPFFLGALLALALYPRLADPHVPFLSFALFLGAAMSITAFPVLARILNEHRLNKSPAGTVALACAAVDDVSAWCILAAVIVVARAGHAVIPLSRTLAGTALFAAAMFAVARPVFRHFARLYHRRGAISQDALALVLLCVLAGAWTAEWIGIHALFGAFLTGALMPRDSGFVRALTQKLEDFAVVLLLPLFFAFTGLRTSVRLLSGAEMWICGALILLVAVAGKLGGSAAAARLCGMSWREAAAVGILMNTRGLMELIILNVGLDIGVISPALFAMMVLMAIVTTFMTSPLLNRVYPEGRQETAA